MARPWSMTASWTASASPRSTPCTTNPGCRSASSQPPAGPLGASVDGFRIRIDGKGAHGADPHRSIDPLVVGANVILALQTIVSRNVDPRHSAVVTVGSLNAGKASNVIPDTAEMGGTCRTFDPGTRDLIEARVRAIAEKTAEAYGATAAVTYRRMFPPVVNHVAETAFAVQVARSLVGDANVNDALQPVMGSEDFAFMLEARPGNIMQIGNGATAGLHEARFDFNDDAIPYGIAYFRNLVERGLPL